LFYRGGISSSFRYSALCALGFWRNAPRGNADFRQHPQEASRRRNAMFRRIDSPDSADSHRLQQFA
jgi:hypothetical protein